MIEDALFLALGFCTATVLAIACLPLLWARALRLTRQRLELLVPWSKREIDAERDGLRAQAAVDRRRLEQEAERSRAAAAASDAVLGARTVDLVRTEKDRDALREERARLISELTAQTYALHDAEGQRFAAEKALHDADRRIESDAVAAREQVLRYQKLSGLAEERRGTIAALETRVAGLLATVEDRDDALMRWDAAMAQIAHERASLAAEHETLATSVATLRQAHEETERDLAQERERAVERDRRLTARTEALRAAEARLTEQDAAMKHKDAQLQVLQTRFDALAADLAASREAAASPEVAAEQDARLRGVITELGDDALALLSPAAVGSARDLSHRTDVS